MPNKLQIDPVKIDRKRLGELEPNKILPRIPHLILTIGKVRSGKSVMYNNLYLKPEMYGNSFDVKVLLSPTAHQDEVNAHLIEEFDFIIDEVNETIIEELLEMVRTDETDRRYLFIFDDVIGSITQKKGGAPDILSALSTKYRHMGNEHGEGKLSIMICTQYFKFLTPTLRNNASAYLLMGHFSSSELKAMAENLSVFGGGEKEFMDIYKKSRKKPFDFTYLDMGRLRAWRNFENKLFSEEDLNNK